MDEERTDSFIRSLERGNTAFLNELEERARRESIPVIRPAAQNLLRLFLELKKPDNILEVGSAVGFSAVLMAEYSGESTHITTIEKYEPRLKALHENIAASGFSDRITVIEGDAAVILGELKEQGRHYELIFMDAAKAQYINFLPCVRDLLSNGGVLISDNVLQDGAILESRFAVERRDRTIHSRMREYLYELTHSNDLVTSILPVADGITVSVKRGKIIGKTG
ncbi:MAG TPA: O-methyltransferase [Lachnospiraceae bacterium]|nr:O-methyltransferase [Lachnospiraceae bacterium]